jgi:4-aminobutyrate aminotransferase
VDRDREWTSHCYIKEYPLVIARGDGAMVEDVDGNRFLDFMAGIAVAATGFSHPEVVRAVQEAAGKFLHICGSDSITAPWPHCASVSRNSLRGRRRSAFS